MNKALDILKSLQHFVTIDFQNLYSCNFNCENPWYKLNDPVSSKCDTTIRDAAILPTGGIRINQIRGSSYIIIPITLHNPLEDVSSVSREKMLDILKKSTHLVSTTGALFSCAMSEVLRINGLYRSYLIQGKHVIAYSATDKLLTPVTIKQII